MLGRRSLVGALGALSLAAHCPFNTSPLTTLPIQAAHPCSSYNRNNQHLGKRLVHGHECAPATSTMRSMPSPMMGNQAAESKLSSASQELSSYSHVTASTEAGSSPLAPTDLYHPACSQPPPSAAPATCPASQSAAASPSLAASPVASPAASAAPSPPGSPPRQRPQQPRVFEEGVAYQCYNAQGQLVGLKDLCQHVLQRDVCCLGEYHDDPIAHHLELEIFKAAAAAGQQQAPAGSTATRRVVLSLEMFETDTQVVMDEYLAGMIREADLVNDGRSWPNYKQDYRPLVQLAAQQGLRVVCANTPRRYVSLVGKRGMAALGDLPPSSLPHLPPLPVHPPSEKYKNKIRWLMAQAMAPPSPPKEQQQQQGTAAAGTQQQAQAEQGKGNSSSSGDSGGSSPRQQQAAQPAASAASAPESPKQQQQQLQGQAAEASGEGGKECPYIGLNLSSNFFDAQNLWDASMAHSISRALQQPPLSGTSGSDAAGAAAPAPSQRPLVVHVCGKAHCEHGLGIVEHLAHYSPGVKTAVVVFIPVTRPLLISPQEFLVQHKLGTLADFVVLTDGELPRSYETMHPV